jgi:6-phosphofructo-2-kinase
VIEPQQEAMPEDNPIALESRATLPLYRPALPGLEVPGLTQTRKHHKFTSEVDYLGPKLVIVMVGLPARGKSYISKKLARYLNWLQFETKVFNAGQTRRGRTAPTGLDYSAHFFDPDNVHGMKLREEIALETLDDLLMWLQQQSACVGILDATNSTIQRRQAVLARVRRTAGPSVEVLFLESCCYDHALLKKNILLKLSGPDYKHQVREASLVDFQKRVDLYKKRYIPMGSNEIERQLPYLQLIDVGRQVIANCINGFLSAQVVEYLLNFRLQERQIWITRNGESVDDEQGIIGRASPLSPKGARFASALARFIDGRRLPLDGTSVQNISMEGNTPETGPSSTIPSKCQATNLNFHVWTSMMKQTIDTSQFFDDRGYRVKYLRMLDDLHAGKMEGLTFAEIISMYGDEMALRRKQPVYYRWPGSGGESYADLINRLRPIIIELERMEDDVLLITHRAVARVLLAYFQELDFSAITEIDVPLGRVFSVEVVCKLKFGH